MVTSTVVDTYLVENRTKKFSSFGELDWNRGRVELNIEVACFIKTSCRGATLRNPQNNILQNCLSSKIRLKILRAGQWLAGVGIPSSQGYWVATRVVVVEARVVNRVTEIDSTFDD